MSIASMIERFGVTVSTSRSTQDIDATGGIYESYSAVITSTRMAIQRAMPADSEAIGARRTQSSATGYTRAGQNILVGDFVELPSGETFIVRGIYTPADATTTDYMAMMVLSLDGTGGIT